jgi:copper(I)-binding protein
MPTWRAAGPPSSTMTPRAIEALLDARARTGSDGTMHNRAGARTKAAAWRAVALGGMLALAGLGHVPAGHAHSYKLGSLAVGHIWAPPTSDDSAAVYGPIMNQGEQTDRLIAASTDIADATRFRKVENGRASFPDAITIAPGKVAILAPWREHLWLTGLKRPLQDGDSFEMTLTFENSGALTVTVLVEPAAGH